MKKLIIIPTYNESKTITTLIKTINSLNIKNLDILIIDDNSPDKTAELILKQQKHCKNLYLIKRPAKLGLGSAYIAGFKYAIKNNYTAAIQLDGDFSHNPEYLPEYLKYLPKYDFVVCSRYIKNGGVRNWSWTRKLISRGGCFYAKTILNSKINDLTGGYNIWKTDIFNGINIENISSNGYSFQIELKHHAAKKYKFIELPIIFTERRGGKSKMGASIFIEGIYKVWQLKWKDIIKRRQPVAGTDR